MPSTNKNSIRSGTFITDLIGHANIVGYQKNNSYIVFIHGPGEQMFNPLIKPENVIPISTAWKQRLALTCTEASLPGKALSTVDFSTYGPQNKMPYVENYTNEITLTFNCSTDMFEKNYFTAWHHLAVSPNNHSIRFYDNYAKKFSITIMVLPNSVRSFDQLSSDRAFNTLNKESAIHSTAYDRLSPSTDYVKSIYFIQLEECYPIEIIDTPLSYRNDGGVLSFSVRMAFGTWFDPVAHYDQQIAKIQRSYATDVDSVARVGRIVQERDPTVTLGIPSAYADRGRVLDERDLNLKEDRVGMQQTPLSPFQKLIEFARDAVRYSNPKELKQLIVDRGLDYLGSEYGIENVESVARAGQVIDVVLKSKDNTINKARDGIGGILNYIQ